MRRMTSLQLLSFTLLMFAIIPSIRAEGTLPFGDSALPFGDGTLPFGMTGSAKFDSQSIGQSVKIDLNFLPSNSPYSVNPLSMDAPYARFQIEASCPNGMRSFPVGGAVVLDRAERFNIIQVCAPSQGGSGPRKVTAAKGAEILVLSGSLQGQPSNQRFRGNASLSGPSSDGIVKLSFELR